MTSPAPQRGYLAVKRAADVACSAAALVLAAPLGAVIAAAIKADSPGPVLFRQQRVGRGGREFTIYKFRTMTPARPGERRIALSPAGDARVTRVGAVLRASKLDELPQLVNVLRGDMSLVGPRPEVPGYVAAWPPGRAAIILSMRPGLTDPVSVELRDEAALLAAQSDPAGY